MSGHTPGPWLENNDDGVIHDAGGIPVCEVTAPGPTEADLATAISNARLIVAAPDLLAALERVGCQDTGSCGEPHPIFRPDGLCFVCAAIARARGTS